MHSHAGRAAATADQKECEKQTKQQENEFLSMKIRFQMISQFASCSCSPSLLLCFFVFVCFCFACFVHPSNCFPSNQDEECDVPVTEAGAKGHSR